MRWVPSLWKSNDLALAIDPTTLSDRLSVAVASAVYRGCAIPVAWVAMPGGKPGKWIDPAVELLDLLTVSTPRTFAEFLISPAYRCVKPRSLILC